MNCQQGRAAGAADGMAACMETPARTCRVLLVDDHPIMRDYSRIMLESHPGVQVVAEAANGLEAIVQARRLRPDLIVMDVSMPVMNGIEATRRIKAELPDIRVIGFSSFNDDGVAASMLRAGAESYVVKSGDPEELLSAMEPRVEPAGSTPAASG